MISDHGDRGYPNSSSKYGSRRLVKWPSNVLNFLHSVLCVDQWIFWQVTPQYLAKWQAVHFFKPPVTVSTGFSHWKHLTPTRSSSVDNWVVNLVMRRIQERWTLGSFWNKCAPSTIWRCHTLWANDGTLASASLSKRCAVWILLQPQPQGSCDSFWHAATGNSLAALVSKGACDRYS